MTQIDHATRIGWLHEQLTGGEYPCLVDITQQFNVHPATVYRDLDFLKHILKAPLQYDYDKNGYFYDGDFELPEISVGEGELVGVLLLDQLRKAYEDTDIDPLIGRAIDVLSSQMSDELTLDHESLDQVLQVEIEPFPRINLNVFQDLLQAIRANESVIIKYFSGQKAVVVEKPCDPYHLLNFKNNWYLVAFCHEKQDFRDFLCSRIMSVERTNTTFLPDPDFSLEEHKKDSQLFASDAPQIEIVAEFDKYAAHWIRLREIHPSQKVMERSDGSLEVSFNVSASASTPASWRRWSCRSASAAPSAG